jgi:hypothetical protein
VRKQTVAARLRPVALAILTGVGASELTDRSVQLAELIGHSAGELGDRMSTATPVDAQGQMATFLSRRFSCAEITFFGRAYTMMRREVTLTTMAAGAPNYASQYWSSAQPRTW